MKTLCKFFISFAIIVLVAFVAKVIANCTDMSYEVAYCYVASVVIGALAVNVASWIIDKITDKHE